MSENINNDLGQLSAKYLDDPVWVILQQQQEDITFIEMMYEGQKTLSPATFEEFKTKVMSLNQAHNVAMRRLEILKAALTGSTELAAIDSELSKARLDIQSAKKKATVISGWAAQRIIAY